MNTTLNKTAQAVQAPMGAPQDADLDEAALAAHQAAIQAAIAERKERNKGRSSIVLWTFAAVATTLAIWNIVILAILFPVLVVALMIAGKFWAGWTGGDEDFVLDSPSLLDPRHILCASMGPADQVRGPWAHQSSWDD